MKKQINIEKFPIREILLSERTIEKDGVSSVEWQASILYAAEDAQGVTHYAKRVNLQLDKGLVEPLVTSLSRAVETLEVNPPQEGVVK